MGWLKMAWGAASGFVSGHMIWFKVGAIALVGTAIVTHFWLDGQRKAKLVKARATITDLRAANQSVLKALEINRTTLNECLVINRANAAEYAEAEKQAAAAAARVATLEAISERDIEDIDDEVAELRTDLDCPALTPAFREWVRH